MSATVSRTAFVAGIVIAILASSSLSMIASSQLSFGPKGDKGDVGPQGAQGPKGDQGIPGESAMEHGFVSPPAFDSGWLNITDKRGQYFTIDHGLNTTEVLVDVKGKQEPDLGNYILWSRTYGGLRANTVVQTSDGGYAMAGLLNETTALLVKTNVTGDSQWSKTYSLGICEDRSSSLVKTNDGGFAIAGSHFTLVKTDALGNMQWSKTFVQFPAGYANSLVQTSDSGYAIAGPTNQDFINSTDFALVKTDASGNLQWTRTYDVGSIDHAYSMLQANDGGYVIVGYTKSATYLSSPDFLVVKTDSAGTVQWSKTYGGGIANSVVQTADGGYAIASTGFANLVKTDASGNLMWSKTYSGVGNHVIMTGDGGYALCGGGFALVKVDTSGNMQWSQTFRGTGSGDAYSLIQTSDSEYLLAGSPFSVAKVDLNRQQKVEHQMSSGLDLVALTDNTLVLYRSGSDTHWSYLRVRIWKIKDNP